MILERGDRVAIVEPASAMAAGDRALLAQACELLEAWGLSVSFSPLTENHFYLAASDEARARQLRAALADPAIRAIFCARGGYGTMRLFCHLASLPVSGPKLLIGYSDITALLLAARKLWPDLALVHGPNVASEQLLGDDDVSTQNRQALRRALFEPDYAVDLPIEVVRPGSASGPLIGGCLSLLAATIGSRFAVEAHDHILFIEDTKEAPYRIDRMLTQLRNAGVFAHVGGVVFGVMPACDDGVSDLRAVIADVFADADFPVVFGLPAGHGPRNVSLPLGRIAVLDGSNGRFHLCAS